MSPVETSGHSDPAAAEVIAEKVREALARRRISRQRLADEARISLSTLEKALAGRRTFTLATLVRLEEALGVSLRTAPAKAMGPAPAEAPDALGAYTRVAVNWMIGGYLTLRPSFENPDAVYAYRTDIAWDEAASCLKFRESARLDTAYTQEGEVALNTQTGHAHLVTNFHGQYRLVTLGRPTIAGAMYGLLNTLQVGPGGRLTPLVAPLALLPLKTLSDPTFGLIPPGHASHADYRGHVARVLAESYARLIPA